MQENDFDSLLNNLNEKNLEQYAKTHLSASRQKKLQEILSDKAKLEKILAGKEAQELMKKLKGKKNG